MVRVGVPDLLYQGRDTLTHLIFNLLLYIKSLSGAQQLVSGSPPQGPGWPLSPLTVVLSSLTALGRGGVRLCLRLEIPAGWIG